MFNFFQCVESSYFLQHKMIISNIISIKYCKISKLLLKMFQDLDPDSVYVKIIEYSIAGKHFLTDDIWDKILLKNHGSGLKTILKLISTIKVLGFENKWHSSYN